MIFSSLSEKCMKPWIGSRILFSFIIGRTKSKYNHSVWVLVYPIKSITSIRNYSVSLRMKLIRSMILRTRSPPGAGGGTGAIGKVGQFVRDFVSDVFFH